MVTIADVAQAAGVSISTVSYVMSGKRAISQETRTRVEKAIDSLGFSPHAGARSLASRSTNVIGLQAPLRTGVDVHVVMQIVTGVVTQARKHGYDILLLASDDAKALQRAAKGSMVDALLVMDVESDDPRIETLSGLGHPSVLIGLPEGRRAIPCVDFDFEAAGWLAVDRLVALGHRRLALIGSPPEVMTRHTSYADRLVRGFLAACEASGVTGSVHACPSTTEAVATVDAVMTENPDITGFFVHNEGALPHVAATIGRSARQRGDDLAVLALCPDDVARSVPGLADSIAVPAEGIGAAATDMICEILANGSQPAVRLLPPALTGTPTAP
ncbi:LacI family DNA-binding transcriptional regulator [Microbacterium sp. M3]|uniref:LacI family DNA-binding transcriptional regulator n=1 Tax=Microbacterium arthrosphaerae TaxID=792652 RepID=A0ABU4GY51_9MICO|nr:MULTISPECIES: LacI family DNA-binding transcriptional regulator [Microbacterium]MDW4572006.1 LacI family DNA-binding transcriptional regulator [Microbacterium arthrosphaerae]MDW7605861.1 LacI family DNA-binding transcriptional regulator [Microbacterium sp. M3]